MSEYRGLVLEKRGFVAWLKINRPEKRNALDPEFWPNLKKVLRDIDLDEGVRSVVLYGEGKGFSSGLDLTSLASIPAMDMAEQTPRNRMDLLVYIREWQEAINEIERCRKPVIAAVHGHCLGAGLDIVSACDIRLASEDAIFSVRETAMAMVADLGSLQRLPRIIGEGLTRELAFTSRDVTAKEALEIKLVNRLYSDRETLLKGAEALAEEIASNSPLAVQSTKEALNFSRDATLQEGLHYSLLRNSLILPSPDLMEAFQAFLEKRKPKF